MLQLKNKTPFQANIAIFPNEQGVDTLYVVVKATFSLGSTISVAEAQRPVVLADEYWGEPGLSSIKYASEAHLTKPATDVVMVGVASAPDRRPMKQLDVTVTVADRRKTIRVFGDRVWEKGWIGVRMSAPLPFETIPLVYERAFGGVHEVNPEKKQVIFEPRNPVGCSFMGKRKTKQMVGMRLPNLEDPSHLMNKPRMLPPPVGVGALSSSWEPRKSYAGTYDAVWQKTRAPYLPDDFNPRFFNVAHPDLVCHGYLKGGEPLEIINVSPNGPIRCTLPICRLETAVRIAGRTETPPLNLETVLLEPSNATLCLTWRSSVQCDKKTLKVEQVDITLQNMDLQRTAA